MPTDSRTSPSGTVRGSSPWRRRRSTSDSTPPRLVAWHPEPHGVDDGVGRRRAADDLDGEHRAEAAHLASGELVAGVVGRPG